MIKKNNLCQNQINFLLIIWKNLIPSAIKCFIIINKGASAYI